MSRKKNQFVDSETLAVNDVRSLVRLLGEVAEMEEPVRERRKSLIEGLCALVDGDVWIWTITRFVGGGDFAGHDVLCDGLDEREMALFYEGSYDRERPMPEAPGLVELIDKQIPFTRRRQQLVSDEKLYGSDHTNVYRKALRIDQSLYSFYPLEEGVWSCVGLHRKWGRPPFTPRDARLVHIVFSEIEWLHRAAREGEEVEHIPSLPPRLRVILGLLLEGQNRKLIAANLDLSEYTVRDYMSEIYRYFGVRSQVELVRRLTAGDGRDGNFS